HPCCASPGAGPRWGILAVHMWPTIVDARCKIEEAPDEHTEMRYPTRASESANRRLSSSAPCAARQPYIVQLRNYYGERIVMLKILDNEHQSGPAVVQRRDRP